MKRTVPDLSDFGDVVILSKSESRRAWREMRRPTLWQRIVSWLYKALAVFVFVVVPPSLANPWWMHLIAAGVIVVFVLLLLKAGEREGRRRFGRVHVSGDGGLALVIRDWYEPRRSAMDPTAPVYVSPTEITTLNSRGVVQEVAPGPTLRFGISPGRGKVRRVWIDGEPWPAFAVPL